MTSFKHAFLRRAGILLCCALPAAAEADDSPGYFSIRTVTISAPRVQSLRAAMEAVPATEHNLFHKLTKLIATGEAELLSDTLTCCREEELPANNLVSEIPYCTDWSLDSKRGRLIPKAATFRNAGTNVDCLVRRSPDESGSMLSVTWSRTRQAGNLTWPVLTVKTFTEMVQPQFQTEQISGTVSLQNGAWQLAGMLQQPVRAAETGLPARELLTFAKVSKTGKSLPPPSSADKGCRLHCCVFRIPAGEGVELALHPPSDDSSLLDTMMRRSETGEVKCIAHASLSLRQSPTASTESILEYPFPTTNDPDPGDFNYKNTGDTLKVSVSSYGPGRILRARVQWETRAEPFRFLQLSPQPAGATLKIPEFSTESLDTSIVITPGSVQMSGLWTLPGDGGARLMDVCFLKWAGPSPKENTSPPGFARAFAGAFSLPPELGSLLSAHDVQPKWEALEPLIRKQTARLLAWQCISGVPGTKGTVKRFTETPSATRASSSPAAGGLLYGTETCFRTLGDQFDLDLPRITGEPFRGQLSVTWEGMKALDPHDLLKSAENGASLSSAFSGSKTVFPPTSGDETEGSTPGGRTGPPLDFGTPQVISLSPCTAPAGDAEHDRWHAIVLFIQK